MPLLRPRSLRPIAFALGWLVVFEIVLRVGFSPDARVLRDPQHPFGCFADDEQARLVAARRQAPVDSRAFDVVLVGDSVLASVNNAPGEQLADFLGGAVRDELGRLSPPERSLPEIRVWNLASGGSRAADVYAALRRLAAQLGGRPGAMERLLVVANTNVIFFSRRHRQPALLYPCLAPWLVPALSDEPALRARLQLPAPPATAAVEQRLSDFLARHLYLYQQRRRIAELVLGGPPREALRERLTDLGRRLHHREPASTQTLSPAALRDLPWTARGLTAAQYAPNFDLIPPSESEPEAVNFALTARMARFLGTAAPFPSLVVLTPQNHALLGALAEGPRYDALTAALAAEFAAAGVPFVSLDHDPAIASELFADLDHLTTAGNRVLATRLARELAPRLRDLMAAPPGGAAAP